MFQTFIKKFRKFERSTRKLLNTIMPPPPPPPPTLPNRFKVSSLYPEQVESNICAACHAFRLHAHPWRKLERLCVLKSGSKVLLPTMPDKIICQKHQSVYSRVERVTFENYTPPPPPPNFNVVLSVNVPRLQH